MLENDNAEGIFYMLGGDNLKLQIELNGIFYSISFSDFLILLRTVPGYPHQNIISAPASHEIANRVLRGLTEGNNQ